MLLTHMAKPSKQFKTKLLQLLQEEEVDLYVLTMHYRNDGELAYFDEPDRRRVKHILDILIRDTKRHSEILQRIVRRGI